MLSLWISDCGALQASQGKLEFKVYVPAVMHYLAEPAQWGT
jgi:hypothetical protein